VTQTARGKTAVNQGQVQLAADPRSHEAIGKLVGASKQVVAEWRAGRKKPSYDKRLALKREVGIDPAAFDLLPVPETSITEADEEAEPVLDDDLDRRIAEAWELFEQSLVPSEKTKVLGLATKLEELRERRKSDRQRLIESDDWADMEKTITAALDPHPLAYVAVGAALARMSGREDIAGSLEARRARWDASLVAEVERATAKLVKHAWPKLDQS
jgi:hypothetical protein